ncbi:unnamed protein product [Natator depressus]
MWVEREGVLCVGGREEDPVYGGLPRSSDWLPGPEQRDVAPHSRSASLAPTPTQQGALFVVAQARPGCGRPPGEAVKCERRGGSCRLQTQRVRERAGLASSYYCAVT